MGGGGHMPKIPDYKIYKVENIPELMVVKRALAAEGLKDPWLRNEVWRYDRNIRGTTREIVMKTAFRGGKIGFGLAVLTTVGVKMYEHFFPEEEHHGAHGHH